jgi:thioredoxin reductase
MVKRQPRCRAAMRFEGTRAPQAGGQCPPYGLPGASPSARITVHRIGVSAYDVIIVGGGPAGLSAALVLGHCRRRVLVCDAGHPRNAVSHAVSNFLTREGTPPHELLRIAREEVESIGVEFQVATVLDAECRSSAVEVRLDTGVVVTGRKLLLATGVSDELPRIEGLRELYGASVFHCPYCDGWGVRDQPLAAYGKANDAIGLALSLLTWSCDVVACTDGDRPSSGESELAAKHDLPIRTEKILRLEGRDGRLERIVFESGDPLERRALFFNTGQGQRCDMAEKLGCRFDSQGHVRVDTRGRTGVTNVFLAGDASGDVQFVIAAAADGAKAGTAINRELQEEDRS